MDGNSVGFAINVILGIISIGLFMCIAIRIFRDKFSAEKSVKATVIDKQTYLQEQFFKTQAPKTEQKYIVTFMSGKKKMSFNVSPLSYNGYKVNQTGMLKYKGSKIIDFR